MRIQSLHHNRRALARRGRQMTPLAGVAVLIASAFAYGRTAETQTSSSQQVLRMGFFANVTHAPAIIGVMSGRFQRSIGPVALRTAVFSSGPDEMEALNAGAIDVAFVGPVPAVNEYVRNNGRGIVVLSGVCNGGASLIARRGSGINSIVGLSGQQVAVPQVGGTQDISLRMFLTQNGLASMEKGGNVKIVALRNPDILALFQKNQLDAAWVPEPWASRIVDQCRAIRVVDERDLWPNHRFTTTICVARSNWYASHSAEARDVIAVIKESIKSMNGDPAAAQVQVNNFFLQKLGKKLSAGVMRSAWSHTDFTAVSDTTSIKTMAATATAQELIPNTNLSVDRMFRL